MIRHLVALVALLAPLPALAQTPVDSEAAIVGFLFGEPDIATPKAVDREAAAFRRHTGCDYRAALAKYGDDISARRACHGLLFY